MPQPIYLDLTAGTPRPTSPPQRAVLCLGNFDGVHLAHQALLREGVRLASLLSTEAADERVLCGVFCFFSPSVDYLPHTDDQSARHLTCLRDKLARFAAAGVDFVCLCNFRAVRDLPPAAFMTLLQESCRCEGIVCGFNYRFGKCAAGTPADLVAAFGAERVVIMPEIKRGDETVSSSRIRAALLRGEAEVAADLLGRPYSLCTTVTGGKRLGRTIGFPTANQYFLPESLIPAHGVYVARCHTPEGVFSGVANVGCHPTVDVHARVNCETYILDFEGDLYGRRMETELLYRLRPEQKFADLDTLVDAIRADADQARRYIAEHVANGQP